MEAGGFRYPEISEDYSVRVTLQETTGNFKLLFSVSVTPTKLIDDIFKEVAEKYAYQTDEIEIVFRTEHNFTALSAIKDNTLLEADLWPISTDDEFTLIPPKNKNMSLSVSDVPEDDLLLGASASPTIEFATSEECSSIKFNYESIGFHNQGRRKATQLEPIIVESSNYVGLVNQAMTCYLNSLLQALFMTPEFRNALYNWEFDGSHETRSIPYQLQKLFLNLQTSTKSAVETTDLTTSFGWQGSDAWHQHDIQELCRVMFDALEQKFKDTKQANLINDLYEGKMLDYVKCLECGTEKSREDSFLDIPLPVRPFGSTVAYNSVEEALRAFVQPETLDGNNQYFCEKCNKKCDAHKGLKFTKFPYLLTLHLKRFDFDYNTMHRIKLNDKVGFPEKLNLNPFVSASKSENDQGTAEGETIVKYDDCSTTDSGSADDESCQGTDLSSTVNGQDDNCADSDEGIDVSSGNNHHENEAKGPYLYDLFSIMIHSGSASGGHYYAYIKDFDKNLWFCFNDQSVTPITEDDIRKTYGGGPQRTYYSGAFSSSTNAYMLMYRQIDKERNINAMTVMDFPPHINKLLHRMRQKEEEDRIIRKKEDEMIKITVSCCIGGLLKEVKISTFSDSTLAEVAQHAYNRLRLDGSKDSKDCRIVAYNKKNRCIDTSFPSEEIKFHDIIQSNNLHYSEWMLEVREPGTPWKEYKKGGINMSAYLINIENEDIAYSKVVRVDVDDTVGDLKQKLGELFTVEPGNIKVVLQSYTNEQKYLKDDSELVNFDSNFSEYKLFIANIIDKDSENLRKNISKLKKIAELYSHVIALSITLPVTSEAILESLSIPLLDTNLNLDRPDQNIDRASTSSPALRVSPQPGSGGMCGDGYDQSNSEDSSLSDSDRTLIGDAPTDCVDLLLSNSASPADQHMASPSDPCRDTYNYDVLGRPGDEMSWDDAETETDLHRVSSQFLLFKLTTILDHFVMPDEGEFNVYSALVDKRITLEALKKHLESTLRVSSEYFKVFKHHAIVNDELTRLSETLRLFTKGDMLIIKLGRVLREDEHLCKIFHLTPDNMDPNNLLFEHVITKNQTVLSVKKEIIQHAKKEKQLDIAHDRCRLREKNWKKPKKVYLDDQKFGDEIMFPYNLELYLQELSEPETVTSNNQFVVFLRKWSPSELELGPFEEVVLDVLSMDYFKTKISTISGIPVENLNVSHVKGNFPWDMHLLEIHLNLEWDPKVKSLDQWPISVEDGCMFFYKDSTESPKELTPEEKKEIKDSEDARLGRFSTKNYSPGRERALKIYLYDSSTSKHEEEID